MSPVVPALQIGARLGNGHFGVVYEGQDNVHGLVAVKVLSRDPFDSDAAWQSYKLGFLAEAQHLSQATHRNVVQVYHIEEMPDGNSIRFCMEHCPGGSLQAHFEIGPMLLLDVRKTATDTLLGLTALHLRNMLHRDIKPGNILIDRNGVAKLGLWARHRQSADGVCVTGGLPRPPCARGLARGRHERADGHMGRRHDAISTDPRKVLVRGGSRTKRRRARRRLCENAQVASSCTEDLASGGAQDARG